MVRAGGMIGIHLASLNLSRNVDGSLHIIVEEADGAQGEMSALGLSGSVVAYVERLILQAAANTRAAVTITTSMAQLKELMVKHHEGWLRNRMIPYNDRQRMGTLMRKANVEGSLKDLMDATTTGMKCNG
jgi:hypothetical protein